MTSKGLTKLGLIGILLFFISTALYYIFTQLEKVEASPDPDIAYIKPSAFNDVSVKWNNEGNAYDENNATSATETQGRVTNNIYFSSYNNSGSGSISNVDLFIRWDVSGLSDDVVDIGWYVSGTQIASYTSSQNLQINSGNDAADQVSFIKGTTEPNDGAWSWTDIGNIEIRWVGTKFGGFDTASLAIDEVWGIVIFSPPDTTPPTWSSPNVNITNPSRGKPVNISVVWNEPNSGLDFSWLETNETGSWKNYTDGTYGSPRDISGNFQTINFTWTNDTGKPRVIGWRIYANNTGGYENGTNNPSGAFEGNFTMWGWSNVTWSSPDDGSATAGDIVELACFVNDTNTTGSGPIQGYYVTFYNETFSASSLLGTNYTNSSGHAIWSWNTTGLAAGTYYPKCNITDNSTLYYNASEYYQANTTITVQNIVEITLSQALSNGIIFGDVIPNTVGNPAQNNTSGPSGGTEYNVTVGPASTNNIDFYVKLNETFESGIYINDSSSTTSAFSGFSTNTTITATWSILGNTTSNCTSVVIGGNCWMRFYFDVGNVPPGYKERNYTICGVVTGNNPSICG